MSETGSITAEAEAATDAIAESAEAATDAIADSTEAATDAIAETTAEVQDVSVPPPFLQDYALNAMETQNELLRSNLDLMFRRVDQQSRLLESAVRLLETVTAEMQTTMELAQQMIASQDERQENLAIIAAGLTKAMSRLRKRPKEPKP